MALIIEMPKLSDTMEEGGIASWSKEEGEFVEEGEILCEIETDKATMEYASPEEGHLLKILVQKGQQVGLGAPIAVVGEKGEKFDLDALTAGAKKPEPAAAEEKPAEKPQDAAASAAPTPSAPVAPAHGGRIKASPLARKMAKAKNLDLSQISGTGPHGRIIAKDINSQAAAPQSASAVNAVVSLEDQKLPLSMMRKTIAKRLLAGKNDAPHFYLGTSVNMQALLDWRQSLNEGKEKAERISVNDLVMFAVSRALRKHPTVNSSWQDDHILQYGHVSVAMAVALPTGLVTPVIRNADQLGLRQISQACKSLGKQAKDGNLTSDAYAGGTFTVSNLGMTCIESFTAIINPPQACILAVGKTQQVPGVSAGQVVVQNRMQMTLSCDHRVVDGMVGAQFLGTLVEFLEKPLGMLE